MLAPWECIDSIAHVLRPGGVVIAYVATTTQMSRFVEDLRLDKRWTNPEGQELIARPWHLEGLAVRPTTECRVTPVSWLPLGNWRLESYFQLEEFAQRKAD
jgi:tRNA A58 N-methylase Trm61